MFNTPAQIATGRKLLARFGSWGAVRAASIFRNGVWLVMPTKRRPAPPEGGE